MILITVHNNYSQCKKKRTASARAWVKIFGYKKNNVLTKSTTLYHINLSNKNKKSHAL